MMKKLPVILIILFCFGSISYAQYKVDPETQILLLKQEIEILKLKLELANIKKSQPQTKCKRTTKPNMNKTKMGRTAPWIARAQR